LKHFWFPAYPSYLLDAKPQRIVWVRESVRLAPLEAVRYLSCLYLPYLAFALVSEAKVGAK
jgi:hypothetical protein